MDHCERQDSTDEVVSGKVERSVVVEDANKWMRERRVEGRREDAVERWL